MKCEYHEADNCSEGSSFPVGGGNIIGSNCSQISILDTAFFDHVERTAQVDVKLENGKVVCYQACSKRTDNELGLIENVLSAFRSAIKGRFVNKTIVREG